MARARNGVRRKQLQRDAETRKARPPGGARVGHLTRRKAPIAASSR